MAACLITTGIAAPSCDTKFSIPGIRRKVLVTNFDDISSFSETVSGEIDGITFKSLKGFFELFYKDETGNAQSELTTDAPSGLYFTQTANLRVVEKSTATRNSIEDMADVPLLVLVEESDGQWKVLGESRGVKLSKSIYQTGTVPGDENGWLLTFTGINLGEVKRFFKTSNAVTNSTLVGLTL